MVIKGSCQWPGPTEERKPTSSPSPELDQALWSLGWSWSSSTGSTYTPNSTTGRADGPGRAQFTVGPQR
ncbi:hypothetical protein CEP51_016857 [Fusarium floridanum]|uniref:Uncharacterized protein n=1 Tax=Fusarium floridanum TaxID=1325733 RepID=A0A428NDW8_9HYPO|nr:hypothetical protein CEP51_016857 [Fusarium floridanum]